MDKEAKNLKKFLPWDFNSAVSYSFVSTLHQDKFYFIVINGLKMKDFLQDQVWFVSKVKQNHKEK